MTADTIVTLTQARKRSENILHQAGQLRLLPSVRRNRRACDLAEAGFKAAKEHVEEMIALERQARGDKP